MPAKKTHRGVVITSTGEKCVSLHETITSWVVSMRESYQKATGQRNGAPSSKRRLVLSSVEPLPEAETA